MNISDEPGKSPKPQTPGSNLAQEALVKFAEHVRGLRMYTADEISAIKAEAWEEGATDRHIYGFKARNPYRSAGAGGSNG